MVKNDSVERNILMHQEGGGELLKRELQVGEKEGQAEGLVLGSRTPEGRLLTEGEDGGKLLEVRGANI